jgi:hypothetical protein
MEIFMKENFSKENGMVEEKLYSQILGFKREFGYKIRNNDRIHK